MAKASFHKGQRVYVRPVGTWAIIERVVPHWTKGLDEPLRVTYEVGLGRDFAAEELHHDTPQPENDTGEHWRIVRAENRWQSASETASHPFPGTYPVVRTGEADWGGWRVPGAEYALSPSRIEIQARIFACAPQLARLVRQFAAIADEAEGAETQEEILDSARELLSFLDGATHL
jgi:hypothetical protein